MLSVLYLHYSPLTISKAITSQTEVVSTFMNTLSEQDVLVAVVNSFQYIFVQLILPLFPFLLLLSFGFLILFLLRENIEFGVFSILQILFLFLTIFLTNFSIPMALTYIGILIASLVSFKTFEAKKTDFSTANSLVSSTIRWVNIFLVVGLFLALYLNFHSYEGLIIEKNMELISGFISTEDLQSVQSQLVNQTVDSLEQSITTQYQQIPQETREQCRALHDAMLVGLENYKGQIAEQVSKTEGQELETIESLVTSVPIMNQFVKASPLILALVFLSLLEFLKPFVALGFAVAYSLVKKLSKTKIT